MRVLVTGMGGELGTRVAQLLEQRSDVDEIVGVDFVPPRRRLLRSEFRRIDPRESDKLAAFVTDYAPTVVAHYGVYEPDSRLDQREAAEATASGTLVALEAAAAVDGSCASPCAAASPSTGVDPVVPRYRTRASNRRRRRRTAARASRSRPSPPASGGAMASQCRCCGWRRWWGRMCRARWVVCCDCRRCRFPRSPTRRSRCCIRKMRRARWSKRCAGATTVRSTSWVLVPPARGRSCASAGVCRCRCSARRGSWRVASRSSRARPVPPHVLELMQRGRTADGSRAIEVLGLAPMRSTQEVCAELYEWATVTALRPTEAVA